MKSLSENGYSWVNTFFHHEIGLGRHNYLKSAG